MQVPYNLRFIACVAHPTRPYLLNVIVCNQCEHIVLIFVLTNHVGIPNGLGRIWARLHRWCCTADKALFVSVVLFIHFLTIIIL